VRKRPLIVTAALAGAFVVSACTALVSTAGLSGAAVAAAPTAASCRALHADDVTAPSGVFNLRDADGGAFTAYCDMEAADGG
jgi:hypothetical protein